MVIRPTFERDVQCLPDIERSAAQAFVGWPALAWLAQGDVNAAAPAFTIDQHRAVENGGKKD